MTKTQINFRASAATATKLSRLVSRTGMTQTEVISVAIDRMYREETKMTPRTTLIKAEKTESGRYTLVAENGDLPQEGFEYDTEAEAYAAAAQLWPNDRFWQGRRVTGGYRINVDDPRAQAERRVDETPALDAHRDTIMYDWPEGDEHWDWVITAPISEIVDWAETIERQQ